MTLSNKRIIMIHGLASKPPKQTLLELWQRCIIKNIEVDDKKLAKKLSTQPELFNMAYWANATPHHIEDDAQYVKKLKSQVEKVIQERLESKAAYHVGTKEKVGAFFQDKGQELVYLLTGALNVKASIMKLFLRETQLYDEDQYIADRMRQPLEQALRDAWDNDQEVALISHSMGSFIAYDVLWRFSHRSVSGFKEYRNKKVKMFVTMGSPLGDPTIRNLLFARHHQRSPRLQYPTNIKFWHNYSCLGDAVSHYNEINDSYFEPMQNLDLLDRKPKYRAINYVNLHNPFKVVTTQQNRHRVKHNPHKSYGYLVQPRLGTWLADFLCDRLR